MQISNKTKVALGFIFLLFDYNIKSNGMTFNALPTFIGFFLIYIGLKDLADKSNYFASLKKVSLILTPVFFVIYMVNLLGLLDKLYNSMLATNPDNPTHAANTANLFYIIQLVLNAVLILCVIYAVFLFACGCKEVTRRKGIAIARYGRQLYNTFQIYSVLKVLYLSVYILYVFNNETLAIAMPIFYICAMVASVMFIFQGNRIYELLFREDKDENVDIDETGAPAHKHFRYINEACDDEEDSDDEE